MIKYRASSCEGIATQTVEKLGQPAANCHLGAFRCDEYPVLCLFASTHATLQWSLPVACSRGG